MTIPQNTGTATTTIKVSDQNALITAINAELASLASRIKVLEDKPAPAIPDITPLATKAELTSLRDFDTALEQRLTDRLTALEAAPAARPAPALATIALADTSALARPTGIDPDRIEMVYDQVTLYYKDMEVHAQRIGQQRWRLMATLNYITVSPATWTYDETVEGTADEVYAHALKRLEELARLKPIHDSVHDRVRRMSEGAP